MKCYVHPEHDAIGNCSVCGKAVCRECAVEVGGKLRCRECLKKNASTHVAKNPGVAAVLSFFWTGLGQIYNGQIGKGILLMGIDIVNFLLMFILIGFLTGLVTRIYAIYDAHNTAKKINAGEINV